MPSLPTSVINNSLFQSAKLSFLANDFPYWDVDADVDWLNGEIN